MQPVQERTTFLAFIEGVSAVMNNILRLTFYQMFEKILQSNWLRASELIVNSVQLRFLL